MEIDERAVYLAVVIILSIILAGFIYAIYLLYKLQERFDQYLDSMRTLKGMLDRTLDFYNNTETRLNKSVDMLKSIMPDDIEKKYEEKRKERDSLYRIYQDFHHKHCTLSTGCLVLCDRLQQIIDKRFPN